MTAPPLSATPLLRLLSTYKALGKPADLGDHLSHYGPPPFPEVGSRDRIGEWLIRTLERSGLTGRGGGAFPTARKLRSVAASGRPAVVVVNAAEGEPLSGKDRLLLTVAPHLVLDGAALAACATGARRIIVCVHEGADTAPRVEAAAAERAQARLAPVPIEVHRVPVGYVSSEETALIQHIN